MTSIALAIETHDRRLVGQENYLPQTLENLARAGVWDSELLDSLTVVCGGAQPDFRARCVDPYIPADAAARFSYAEQPATRQQNGRRAIRAAADTDAEWALKLEDDLDFCADFLGSISRWLDDHERSSQDVPMFTLAVTLDTISRSHYQTPGESVLGPGESYPRIREILRESGGRGRGIRIACGMFWGAQAILLRRDHARHLAAWLGDDPYYDDGREQHRARGHDLLLQKWASSLGALHFGAAVPSLVQHIGHQSTISNPWFEFPWPGREWKYEGR